MKTDSVQTECPPLPRDAVTVGDIDVNMGEFFLPQAKAKFFCDANTAMLTSGAADTDAQEVFTLFVILRQEPRMQALQLL